MRAARAGISYIYIYILVVALVSLTFLAGFWLASDLTFADDAAVDTINLTIPEACTLSTPTGSGQTYNAQLANGQYKNDIGKTRLSVFCNTQDSFAVYAVGYSNDTIGNNEMITTTSGATNILTGTATSGDTSNWAMKIEAAAGNGTDIYTPTVLSPFDDFTSVPSSYAKVAEVTSATTRTVEGAIDATYQVYISPNQQAGAYTGKIRYTVVHPASVDPNAGQANLDTGNKINVKLKSLASGTNVTNTSTTDNLITAFVRSDTLPANFTPSDANTISLPNSLTPVYVWFDSNDGTMYYYSKTGYIYANINCDRMFNEMRSLSNISGLKYFLTNNVVNMSQVLYHTLVSDLTPIANWNVGNVTNMGSMFAYSSIHDLTPIANWKVDNVTKMSSMFNSTQISDLTPLANWKVDNVTKMNEMFHSTQISDLTPIANWNVGNVTDMSFMFHSTQISDLTPIANWNVGNVTNMRSMFAYSSIHDLTPLANWNVSNVTNMSALFYNTQISDLTPISNWSVNNVVNMGSMFRQTSISDLTPIANWNVSSAKSITNMFNSIPTLVNASPISVWNVSNVENGGNKCLPDHGPSYTTNNCFKEMFGGTTPRTNLPIFTSRPGTWDSNGTYIPN